MKVAVISGVTGQDGSYLAEFLLKIGYYVIGFSRRVSVDTTERIKHLMTNDNFDFQEGDVCDPLYISTLLSKFRIAEFYNLAAQSHVHVSFSQPTVTTEINYSGVLNVLNCIKLCSPETKFYQASTSEMFGKNFSHIDYSYVKENTTEIEDALVLTHLKCQHEDTPFAPQSPYAIAKLAAHHTVRLYRESYGLFACAGILFNHESPRRGEKFVTRKITKWIGDYIAWQNKPNVDRIIVDEDKDYILSTDDKFAKLRLGNLDAYRDWGHAKDYVRAMWLMMRHDIPDDYVVSTGESHTIREFLDEAFYAMNYDGDWEDLVVVDPEFYRPAEVDYLLGDSTKVKETLRWIPEYAFEDLVAEMVEEDL